MWDVRTVACMATTDLGPHPANRLDFDPSGTVLGVASNDGTVKMIEVATGQATELTAHEDAVQSVLFDRIGEFLVSGGSDGTIRIWSQQLPTNGGADFFKKLCHKDYCTREGRLVFETFFVLVCEYLELPP